MSIQPTSLLRLAGIVVLSVGMTACAGGYVRDQAPTQRHSSKPAVPVAASTSVRRPVHERAAITAVRQIGTPYRYGGADDNGFDCSGLIYYSYRQAGRSVPRTTSTMWKGLQPVSKRDLRVGDVLFFEISGKVSHVGLYLGDRRFVHAPQTGKQVTVAALDTPFYRDAFIRAGRP